MYCNLHPQTLSEVALGPLIRRALRWLGSYLEPYTLLWRPRQQRYRRPHWWPIAA